MLAISITKLVTASEDLETGLRQALIEDFEDFPGDVPLSPDDIESWMKYLASLWWPRDADDPAATEPLADIERLIIQADGTSQIVEYRIFATVFGKSLPTIAATAHSAAAAVAEKFWQYYRIGRNSEDARMCLWRGIDGAGNEVPMLWDGEYELESITVDKAEAERMLAKLRRERELVRRNIVPEFPIEQLKAAGIQQKPLSLLSLLWNVSSIEKADTVPHVWSDPPTDTTIRTCVRKANDALSSIRHHRTLSVRGRMIEWNSGK